MNRLKLFVRKTSINKEFPYKQYAFSYFYFLRENIFKISPYQISIKSCED